MKIKLAQPSLNAVFLSLFVAAVGVLGGGDDVGLGVLGVGDVGAGEPHEALRTHSIDKDHIVNFGLRCFS